METFVVGVGLGFVLGSWWFWFLVGFFLLIEVAIWFDKPPAASGFLLVLILLMLWVVPDGDVVTGWCKAHLMELGIATAFYFPAGVGWAVFKWVLLLREKRDESLKTISDRRERYEGKKKRLARMLDDDVELARRGEDRRDVESQYQNLTWESYIEVMAWQIEPPASKNYRGDIIAWISYWPFSAIHFVLADMFREIGLWLYNRVGKLFDNIAKRVYQEVDIYKFEEPESKEKK